MTSADCQTNFDIDFIQGLLLDSEYVNYENEEDGTTNDDYNEY